MRLANNQGRRDITTPIAINNTRFYYTTTYGERDSRSTRQDQRDCPTHDPEGPRLPIYGMAAEGQAEEAAMMSTAEMQQQIDRIDNLGKEAAGEVLQAMLVRIIQLEYLREEDAPIHNRLAEQVITLDRALSQLRQQVAEARLDSALRVPEVDC